MKPLVLAPNGNALMAFERLDEVELGSLDHNIPLPLALLAVWREGRCLMVRNAFRGSWELPGGMIERGESPRQAAVRELLEEASQVAQDVSLAGVATFRLGDEQRLEYGAVFSGHCSRLKPFLVNDEVSEIVWWEPSEELADIDPIDAELAILARIR
jgi:8-oxo-dGTP diphosphatase